MKNIRTILLAIALIPAALNAAETPPSETPAAQTATLEEQLNALGTPGNEAPAGLTGEQLYAVQTRYAPMQNRHEFSLGGGTNFSGDGFLRTGNLDASYRFYLTNRWFLGLTGNYVFNRFTKAGAALVENNNLVADVAVTKYRADLSLGYHLFYGKFRVSMDEVFYLDQYVALGPGLVVLDTRRSWAGVADVGLALWFGRNFSMHVGVKDYIFYEQRRLTGSLVNNFVGYLQAGYVFGG